MVYLSKKRLGSSSPPHELLQDWTLIWSITYLPVKVDWRSLRISDYSDISCYCWFQKISRRFSVCAERTLHFFLLRPRSYLTPCSDIACNLRHFFMMKNLHSNKSNQNAKNPCKPDKDFRQSPKFNLCGGLRAAWVSTYLGLCGWGLISPCPRCHTLAYIPMTESQSWVY